MPKQLTAGQKAARTRKRRAAAQKAKETRKWANARTKSKAAEAASKVAFQSFCAENGWKVAFFEGKTGAPRTGIIDAIAYRLGKSNADLLDIRLIQLKGGNAGITARELARMKSAVKTVTVDWLLAAFDGEMLHLVPDTMTKKSTPQ